MKIRTRCNLHVVTASLCYGEIMWRCTDTFRTPKYRHEWYVRFDWRIEKLTKTTFDIFLTPALRYLFWRGSVLSRINQLGSSSASCSLWLDWLLLNLGFMFGHNQNLKKITDAELYKQ